jgi:hypothetical protein
LAAGALNETVARFPIDATADTKLGAAGEEAATMGGEVAESEESPITFVDFAWHTYDFPIVSVDTLTVTFTDDPDLEAPPSVDVHETELDWIVAPFAEPRVKLTSMLPEPETASAEILGAEGISAAFTAIDCPELAESPIAFVAVTLQEYEYPALRLFTSTGLPVPVPLFGSPPFDDTQVAVKAVMGDPLAPPGVKATASCPGALWAEAPMVGAAGTLGTTTEVVGADATEVPKVLAAVTEHVYVLSVERPVTVIGVPAADCVWVNPPSLETQVAV